MGRRGSAYPTMVLSVATMFVGLFVLTYVISALFLVKFFLIV